MASPDTAIIHMEKTMKRFRSIAAAGIAVIAASTLAMAAGSWFGLPVIGGSSYCSSTVTGTGGLGGITGQGQGSTGSICGQTVPAGPTSLTGLELIPVDTQAANGAPPQTAYVPLPLVGSINTKVNRLIGGDLATNLWQRGTTPVSAATPSTTVIGADRWAVYSSGNTVTVTKQTAAADSIPASGLYASMRVSRPSGTNTSAICTGQVLDRVAASELIGNNGIFSFYALAGAGFSAVTTNSNVTVTVAYYTAADSATPLTNTDAFMKGTVTGYTAVVAGVSPGTTGAVASGVATIPISTTWTRYSVYAPIPTANAAGTAVTGAGVTICYTPGSGTGGSTEWFEVEGLQLQAMPSTVSTVLPAGVIAPTGFEKRLAAAEEVLQQYYTQGGGLGAELNGAFYQAGGCQASGNANFGITFPTPMRVAPTAATSTLTAGGYSIKTAAAVTAIGTITLPTASIYGVTLNSSAACTSTLPYQLVGSNTTGLILFSAEP